MSELLGRFVESRVGFLEHCLDVWKAVVPDARAFYAQCNVMLVPYEEIETRRQCTNGEGTRS